MQDQRLEETAEEAARLLGPRAVPNTRFIRSLGEDIRRAAYQRIGCTDGAPFEDMIVELRKLVRLLHKMLVPICPRPAFVQLLGEDLDATAGKMIQVRRQRMRWLMLGGMLGSALSLLGVLAALFLRRRSGRLHAKKPLGIA